MSPESLLSRVDAFLRGGGTIVQLDYAGNPAGELRGVAEAPVAVAGPARHVLPVYPSAGPARAPVPRVLPPLSDQERALDHAHKCLQRLRAEVARVSRRLSALEALVAET